MVDSVAESALVVVVPEAEAVVGHWRSRWDSAASLGVQPHVTVLYPFLPPDKIDPDVVASLTTMFTGAGAFQATFSTTAWFADQVLWLAPEDPEPFQRLTQLITASHPTLLPYGGDFDEVVPHLTVGDGGGPDSPRLKNPSVSAYRSSPRSSPSP